MVGLGGLARDYTAMIGGGAAEAEFLGSIPWVLDAEAQEPGPLLRSLRYEATRLLDLPAPPTFTLIAPLSAADPGLVEGLILSARCQSWTRWELLLVANGGPADDVAQRWAGCDPRVRCRSLDGPTSLADAREHALGHASGDFVVFLDADAVLHPSALGIIARRAHGDPATNLIYGNEAVLDPASGRLCGFFTKPPFDPFTLLRFDTLGQPAAIRRDLLGLARRDGRICRPGYDGVEDHDLALRLARTGRVRPIHLPLWLAYRRSSAVARATDPATLAARLRLIEAMAAEVYPGAWLAVTPPSPGSGAVAPGVKIRALADPIPAALLVIVPFRDHLDETLACVESIERQRHDLDATVVLVDNGSADPATGAALRAWADAEPRRCRYRVVEHLGPFNYARINNEAVRRFGAGADLLLFLNNDVELISPDTFQTLALHLLADERAGVAGIRLMFPGGAEVQHGGLKVTHHLIGSGYQVIGHSLLGGEFVRDERAALGVTFACAMTRRTTFGRLGGLEEVMMPNAFGDVDFCVRALELGLRNHYFGTLVGTHGESRTRGRAVEDIEFTAMHGRHAATLAEWRVRQMAVLDRYTWPLIAVPPEALIPPAPPPPPPLALRYRAVDRANGALKVALGPLHGLARAGVVAAGRSLRRARAEPADIVRRPYLFRLRADRAGVDSSRELSRPETSS